MASHNRIRFQIENLSKPDRLDRILKVQFPDWGRKAINQLIRTKQVAVNGKTVWLNSWTVKNGDWVTITQIPEAKPDDFTAFDEEWLIQDDGDILAIAKPQGLLSMQTRHSKSSNLHKLVEAHFGPVSLFHRLDRDTSGVVLFTRKGEKGINRYLDEAFKARQIQKTYFAWVAQPNALQTTGTVDMRLAPDPRRRDKMIVVNRGGQSAITHYEIVREEDHAQFVKLMPVTGRTHQLRVHLAELDAPIMGDRLYSKTWRTYQRLYLHAHQITLPQTDAYPQRTYEAPITWDDRDVHTLND